MGATTTTFAYDGLTLMSLTATQGATSWRIDYLYDEEGSPFGGVYRSPATSTSPTSFSLVTTDRGDVVELCDGNGDAFAAYRCDAWTEAEVTTFVLTDLRYHVVGMTIKRSLIASLPAAAPTTIRVNPRISPRELAREYAKVRARCMPERDRAMSEKHVKLAVFTHRHLYPSRPWVQLRDEWNESHPRLRYEVASDPQARRFALEARDAWCRVSGKSWFDRRQK